MSAGGEEARKRTAVRTVLIGALMIASGAAFVAIVGQAAATLRSERVIELSRIETERYAALLTAELRRYDYLPGSLGYHPAVLAVLSAPGDAEKVAAANRYLEAINRAAGATTLYLVDVKGTVVAASNWNEPASFVGVDLSYRPYVQAALQSGSGRFYGIGTTSGTPGYYFAKALSQHGDQLGAGVIKVNLDRLEARASASGRDVLITDQNGVVILSSRPQWRYRTMSQLPGDVLNSLKSARQYENVLLTPLGLNTEQAFGNGAAIISLPESETGGGRRRFLAQEQSLDNSDWNIVVLTSLSDVTLFKRWAQLAAGLVAVAACLLVLLLAQRRRALRLELEARKILARTNLELEKMVADRTQDLVTTNERLRETQDELVHSAKLAAIGEFAAGVTHELSQPLLAIRTLSDNAGVLIERSEIPVAARNLGMIKELADRILGIASQLKLFARKDDGPLQPVSVKRSIAASLAILDDRTRKIGCRVETGAADGDFVVAGNQGRLDQLFINLIANALDAVSGAPDPLIQITVKELNGMVIILIADNGAGFSADALAHAFEPFFTTKQAGAGLGLGLAICDGVVRQFRGAMRVVNRRRGAEFEIVLPAHRLEPEADHA